MRPNQLATLRELESKVNLGRLAIISGINPDAPIGTKLAFVSGGSGILLWHRSDNLAFAIVAGGADSIQPGEGVEPKVKGILQVLDEARGPITRKEYELMQAPAGDSLYGAAVNYIGQPVPGVSTPANDAAAAARAAAAPGGAPAAAAPAARQGAGHAHAARAGREPAGHRPGGAGKTSLALTAIQGQAAAGVRCVLACTTLSTEQLNARLAELEAAGCLANTAVFYAPRDAPLGTKLATLMAAAAAGERVRDEGGHALVVLDDLTPLSGAWERLVLSLAELGQARLREGLIKDEAGHDVSLNPGSEAELVDYEGMLVSGAVAQRRGFFSVLFLRAAKLSSSFGGGEEQKAKLAAGLEKRRAAEAAVLGLSVGPGELKTETVEEFISISDGQVVLEPSMAPPPAPGAADGAAGAAGSAAAAPFSVNARLCVTRIGSRAYCRALEALAPQIRLDLAQAEDARAYAANPDDPVLRRYEGYCQRIAAALAQEPGQPTPLEELVVTLHAIQAGLADAVPPRDVAGFVAAGLDALRREQPQVLLDIAASKQLTAAGERGIAAAFKAAAAAWQQKQQSQQQQQGEAQQ
ncbi:atpA [Scenedesmus sp. PABB004]|nr:atpA [Scenedesmus sp. PABB004]